LHAVDLYLFMKGWLDILVYEVRMKVSEQVSSDDCNVLWLWSWLWGRAGFIDIMGWSCFLAPLFSVLLFCMRALVVRSEL
jgi:hypothetical protein